MWIVSSDYGYITVEDICSMKLKFDEVKGFEANSFLNDDSISSVELVLLSFVSR